MWSRTGRLFHGFYGTSDPSEREIHEVPYRVTGDAFVAETSRKWSPLPHGDPDLSRSLDVSPDGARFVVAPPVDPTVLARFRTRPTLLVNFFDEIARRIP